MIFWITVALIFLGIVIYALSEKYLPYEEAPQLIGISISALSGIAVICMITVIIYSYAGIEGRLASLRQKYSALVYKSQTESIRDKFGIVNKEYIDEVQEWNMELAKNKEYQRDFWIGIFYPNVFDEFEFINLEDIKYKE